MPIACKHCIQCDCITIIWQFILAPTSIIIEKIIATKTNIVATFIYKVFQASFTNIFRLVVFYLVSILANFIDFKNLSISFKAFMYSNLNIHVYMVFRLPIPSKDIVIHYLSFNNSLINYLVK